MAKPSEWVEADLDALVRDQVGEDVSLEYKACAALEMTDARKDEVSRDVSAFANSAGGTIVYGMLEDASTHLPSGIDGGYDPSVISKDWLENVIHSRIKPKIEGLHINPVQLTGGHAGKVAYVVSVPQSTTAHQASDKRYYKRYNFKREAMEDYEIRDIMNRIKHPFLLPEFSFERTTVTAGEHIYLLTIKLKNTGSVRCRDFKLVIGIAKDFYNDARGFTVQQITKENWPSPNNKYVELTVRSIEIVIHPEDEYLLTGNSGYLIWYRFTTANFVLAQHYTPFLYWKIFADDMPPQQGEVPASMLNNF